METHWFTKQFLTEKLVLNLIPLPALLCKFSSSVYFLKMRRSELCCVHGVAGPWIYIVNFSSYNICRDVFISFGFPICLKKSCVWVWGGYTIAVSGVQGESCACVWQHNHATLYPLSEVLVCLEAEDVFSFFWAEIFLKTAAHIVYIQESITQAQ